MINIEPIKAFSDNYIWLVTTNEGSIVIDPGESKNTLDLLRNKQINFSKFTIGIILFLMIFDCQLYYINVLVLQALTEQSPSSLHQ